MPRQSFILATAGHVDHGKSALVLALTGTDPDRLPEEKARGITIDLGFAHLVLPAGNGNLHGADHYDCGIVDVPGHEDFVRNMVAGVGSIDLALLVVAADDGWMPQTEEHLRILLHLGVRRAVVALTKTDLHPDPAAAAAIIRTELAHTPLAAAPIVPVSAKTGTGLDQLRQALATTLDLTPPPPDTGCARLWVDRVFVLKGVGTVVTGTLTGGPLHRGDPVMVQPGSRTAHIRTCQVHGREVPTVHPGSRTALNLPDLPAAQSNPLEGIRRGDVVTVPDTGPATDTWDVVIERSPRPPPHGSSQPGALPNGLRIHLHLGSGHVPARLLLLDRSSLGPGESAIAQLRLDHPVFAFAGDRFILRDTTQRHTLAGGTLLDPDARRPRVREPARLQALRACAAEPSAILPALFLRLLKDSALEPRVALRRTRFAPVAIDAAVQQGIDSNGLRALGNRIVTSELAHALRAQVIESVDRHHATHPDSPGIPLASLRALLVLRHRLGPDFPIEAFLRHLEADGFTFDQETLRRSQHRPSLPADLVTAVAALRTRLLANPLEPPARDDLVPDEPARLALRHLMETGAAVEIGPGVVLAAEAYAMARTRIRTLLRRQERATASELRQALGTSRRILIPLLERLDREGVTRRDGDHRTLVPRRAPSSSPGLKTPGESG